MQTRKHPKALPYLFLTEMWERFGFYVVQGMLILYMTKAFGYTDDQGYTILGIYSALAYISPFIGGFIADRLLGFKASIIWGGVFLSAGYALLAMPWPNVFYPALATIIVGNGLFKPNISTLLGMLYRFDDANRDSGFTIFYVGINLGVLLAGLSSGYVKDHFGWHAGFGIASVGLIIGLGIFAIGLKYGDMHYQHAHPLARKKFLSKPWLLLYALLSIAGLSFILQNNFLGNWLLPAAGILLLGFMFFLIQKQTEINDRKRLFVLMLLSISSIVFWMLFLQMFFSTNLFIDRLVNKHWFGINIPTTVFYTLESIFVILIGPLFAWSWQSLSQNNNNPSPIIKFVFGIIFVGFGFLILTISTYFSNSDYLINPLWIVLSYFLVTVGELLLSPIGLSAVTLLSPPRLAGLMMGIWFVALGFGGQFAGMLAKLSSVPEFTQNAAMLPIYRQAFLQYALLAWGVAVLLFVIYLLLRKVLRESSD